MIEEPNDVSEMWRVHTQESQDRRAFNRQSSAQILEHHRVQFERHNGGAHLIVRHAGMVVDFWPGTGKWIVRGSGGAEGRGVFPLMKRLGINK